MSRRALAVVAMTASAALGGCTVERVREHPLGCRGDEQAFVRDALYFGRDIPGGGAVSDAQWRAFEDETLVAAFPRGYSVVDVHGHWRGDDGTVRAEETRMVIVLHPDDAASARRLREIAAAYKERFHQEAVLRESTTACVQFH